MKTFLLIIFRDYITFARFVSPYSGYFLTLYIWVFPPPFLFHSILSWFFPFHICLPLCDLSLVSYPASPFVPSNLARIRTWRPHAIKPQSECYFVCRGKMRSVCRRGSKLIRQIIALHLHRRASPSADTSENDSRWMCGFAGVFRGRALGPPLSPCVWLDGSPIGGDAFARAAYQGRWQSVYPFRRDFVEQVRDARDFCRCIYLFYFVWGKARMAVADGTGLDCVPVWLRVIMRVFALC